MELFFAAERFIELTNGEVLLEKDGNLYVAVPLHSQTSSSNELVNMTPAVKIRYHAIFIL